MMDSSIQQIVESSVARAADTCDNQERVRGNKRDQVIANQDQCSGVPNDLKMALNYEKRLRICEPKHKWSWVPDEDISAFWNNLTDEARHHITDYTSEDFRRKIREHVHMRTCYVKNLMQIGTEFAILDDHHSIAVYRDFFIAAVEENVCIAVTWQVVQTVDSRVQDYMRWTARQAGDHSLVDPRQFPKGSRIWVQYREREHARLMLMCLMLDIFERRLLEMWERAHGASRRAAIQDEAAVADQNMAELLAEEEQEKQQQGKGKKKKKKKKSGSVEAPSEDSVKSPSQDSFTEDTSEASGDPSLSKAERNKLKKKEKKERSKELEQQIQEVEAKLGSSQMDEIDEEFNRLVLEHLHARSAAGQNRTVDESRSSTVLKNLCNKLDQSLKHTSMGMDM